MVYAVLDDVADRLGRPISDQLEVTQVNAWIGDVESDILARVPDLGIRIVEEVTLLATVKKIVANAVVRKIHNPAGLTSTTVSVDDGSVTNRRDGYRGGDPLALTDEEWALLLPTVRSSAWSTRPGFEPDRSAVLWFQ